MLLSDDLPSDPIECDALLLAAYGSPDTRQIDGIGGADPLTSKAAIVGLSAHADADVDYTFLQIGIEDAIVSRGGNCGNMLSAVGPFAILMGLVPPIEPITTVRIYTTNTKQTVVARIAVRDGVPLCEGECTIAGVPDAGAAIDLDFGDCSGSVSGKLLPTGAARDEITVDGRRVAVSLIDAATPFVFVDARALHATGCESVERLQANRDLMASLEWIRSWAAVALGLVGAAEHATGASPNVPRVMMVAPPNAYEAPGGAIVAADAIDICVRQLSMQRPHKALAVTGAICAAVASAVPDSIVAGMVSDRKPIVRLGHPSGILRVAGSTRIVDGALRVESARVERTARLIMVGQLFARQRKVGELMRMLGERDDDRR